MARKQRRGGPQSPVPGFRPGKEPPQLRKQRARQQFGDVSPTQGKLIEAFAERTPEEARSLIRRWLITALVAAIALGILGILLMTWSVLAGVLVLIVAAGVLFLWWRLRRQRNDLETMADAVSGGGGSRRKGRRDR